MSSLSKRLLRVKNNPFFELRIKKMQSIQHATKTKLETEDRSYSALATP